MTITQVQVKMIEKKADKLMTVSNRVGANETAKEMNLKSKSLPYIYYHILEDANYHSLNNALENQGIFSGTYANAQKDFDEYQKAGGRTWQL